MQERMNRIFGPKDLLFDPREAFWFFVVGAIILFGAANAVPWIAEMFEKEE